MGLDELVLEKLGFSFQAVVVEGVVVTRLGAKYYEKD